VVSDLKSEGVQRMVNDMIEEGLVEWYPNPHHRRAQLVVLTKRRRHAYEAAERLQAPWVKALAKKVGVDEITAARRIVRSLRERLGAGLKENDR
jgi:DNA-binding MarR family transcriptional regulator